MEGSLYGLCDRITVVFWRERQQLQLYSCHCWLVDQDGVLQTSQSHHCCYGTSGSNHKRGGTISRPFKLHHKGLKSDFYIQVQVFALLLPWYQTTTFYHIPLSDQWINGTPKQHNRSIPSCFCKLRAEWLGMALTNGGVCLQQLQKR